ncbi:hypothetical protein NEUTE1DRAFT_112864 [Neurospora tetrasperma FGSC 2508]|uniref:Uncharacterized protein n=1 Tax=Neurospora tetrasperma (strain FGSC 2508 / ATCC MYA-4615 / P0657) TaxID=510951 RepID=F8MX81_NEUT8|nr:uncharacterized protein NEUTE1DRAFT_112864 [Neurospora tetrasperma FGSC 2508]EGO54352.1 hypothetical protein NEUTE1DRAFT_112864 [Neurospora tetrasperma FGSC 2508]EGZ68209.1 hypothetical protein NEUTE2DRAFT_141864 [Neurospora tetrasperma FGSC 2509]
MNLGPLFDSENVVLPPRGISSAPGIVILFTYLYSSMVFFTKRNLFSTFKFNLLVAKMCSHRRSTSWCESIGKNLTQETAVPRHGARSLTQILMAWEGTSDIVLQGAAPLKLHWHTSSSSPSATGKEGQLKATPLPTQSGFVLEVPLLVLQVSLLALGNRLAHTQHQRLHRDLQSSLLGY